MKEKIGYKHLTREQRYDIEALLQTPMSLREIGEVIGVSKGTVCREIRRNCDMRGHHRYRWQLAQKKYERRMKTRKHFLKFTDEMIAEIEWKLNNIPRKSLGYLTPIEYCKLMFNFDFGVLALQNRVHD